MRLVIVVLRLVELQNVMETDDFLISPVQV